MTDSSHDRLAIALRNQGVSESDINRLLETRARLRDREASNGRNPRMNTDSMSLINASLDKVSNQIKDYKEGTEQKMGEVTTRLASVEQVVAKIDAGGGQFAPRGSGPSAGSRVVAELMNDDRADYQLQNAIQAANQNKKLPAFNSRVTVEGSIRAALVNEGSGNSENTYTIPSNPDRRGFVGPAQRPLRLLDVLPSRPTTSDAVEFVQLQVTGDASEQDTEGDVKAELDIDGVLQRAEIATIAGWTSASKQVLSDHAALQQQIDRVIRNKVLSRLENQLINGTGAQGKIKGLLAQAATFVPTIGTTPADVIGESLVRQANNGYSPNLVLLNPLDWFRIQLTKNNVEGEYVFGSPTMPIPPALWNTSIVATPSLAEGTGMTIDTSYTTVLDREQMTVAVSNQHADFFVRNLVAILGELRAGLEVVDEFAVYKFDLDFPPVST